MSRSYNERSVPNSRGRRGEMKAKRRTHKKARKLALDADFDQIKNEYVSEMIDRETRQSNVGA